MLPALLLVGLANIGFELSASLYNSLLPGLVARDRLGTASGLGWGIGYFGGLACLVAALVVVKADPPPFGLDRAMAEPVRAACLLAAAWFALFAIPLFVMVPDKAPPAAALGGWQGLKEVVREIRRRPVLLRFLLANMIYTDGLNTLFAFGGIYAAGSFGMAIEEVLMFGIALNLTAGLGAAAFAWADDRLGTRRVILASLCCLFLLAAGILLVTDKTWFWALGLCLGVFFGPLQSASRTMMARLAPPEHVGAMFGLFAFSGKATAFLGPALLSAVTLAFSSQRAGMASILVFFVVGGLLLRGVVVPGPVSTPLSEGGMSK
jgi:UMF1 family MFS transporter